MALHHSLGLALLLSPIGLAVAQPQAPANSGHRAGIMTIREARTMPTTLTLAADARLPAVPDQATINAGVIAQATTAQAAMRETAEKMRAVIAALKKAGVADKDMQTSGVSLSPQYRYENNQPPVLTGYQASNSVTVKLRALDRVGATLDSLVGVGANQINGPSFGLAEPDAIMDKARAQALRNAIARATLYAGVAGMKVGRIVSIQESGAMPPPMPMPVMMRQMAMESAQVTNQVVPGEIDISAAVNVTFELVPAT
jgi:uncharacterized protein YggE